MELNHPAQKSNAFLEAAERFSPSVKRRIAAIAQREAEDERKQERSTLLKMWAAYKRAQLEALRNGAHGSQIAALEEQLASVTVSTTAALVGIVRDADWLLGADADTRFGVLSLIAGAITHTREEAGLEPFDDGFPDEVPTPFVLIREMLR
jgi:hypothetical protein